MKKLMFVALFAVLAGFLYAQTAVIKEMNGTVELKEPGSAEWKAASRGDTLDKDTVISTGFKSTAVLEIGKSLLTVRPLTRLSLGELTASGKDEKVELRLQAGRVHAEVNAPPEGKVNFSIRSPSATASVRGTVFDFDTINLNVTNGTVEYTGNGGGSVLVDSGYESYVDGQGNPVDPGQMAVNETSPAMPYSGSDFGAGSGPSGALPPSGFGAGGSGDTGPASPSAPDDPEPTTGHGDPIFTW